MVRIRQRAVARGSQGGLAGAGFRQGLVLLAVGAALWLLQGHFAEIDVRAVLSALLGIAPGQWALAAIAAAGSFWAIGRYDAVLHGLMGTGVPAGAARRGGRVALAIAQFAGFGLLTGALVRWRMVADLTLWQATRVSLAVSASFLAGWAVFAAAMVLIAPVGPVWLGGAALTVLVLAALLILMSVWQPRWLPRLPSLGAMTAILGLAVVDTGCAGLVLWSLLPSDLAIAPLMIAPAFLLALGAGLAGGTPGGAGPFELTLLTLLPHLPTEALLAAALGFRMIYHAVPAMLATVWLFLGPRHAGASPSPSLQQIDPRSGPTGDIATQLWFAPLAEAQLLRHGEFGLMQGANGTSALGAITGQCLILHRRAIAGPDTGLAPLLSFAAQDRRLIPVHYKCSARQASEARGTGWIAHRISDEAVLSPVQFDIARPACRQLRRMLRKAEAAGVTVTDASGDLPLADMTRIAADWSRANGGERGFSMGRFDPVLVPSQRVFIARRMGRVLAFATFNEVAAEWSLDLMRQDSNAPDGTMHLIVAHAISCAAASGCPRLSLAAVPRDIPANLPLPAALRRRIADRVGAAGLRRFKSCFAPRWEPLYVAAPSRLGLLIGLAEIARAVNRPARLRVPPS